MFKSIQIYALFCGLSIMLLGCSGGGSSSPIVAGPQTTLTGTVTFTSYTPTSANGLDYASPVTVLVRGAVVNVRNSSGQNIAVGNTDANGAFSLSVPQNATLTVVVKAALGSPTNPSTQVVDNTAGQALYAMSKAVAMGETPQAMTLHASGGWTGSSYTQARVAGPFAILDVVYKAEQLLRSVDAAVVIPDLRINWSVNNTTTGGNLAIGNIGTSHFNLSTGELYILGREDVDTDEYDVAVIGHEWAHFFESVLSRSDSIGGSHSSGDLLDVTVAFGEGFGTALGGIVNNNPEYIDTIGFAQDSVGVYTDLEADGVNDASTYLATSLLLDGHWSEFSIAEIVWDIFDNDSTDTDADGISLGFAPIYDVMTGGQVSTPAFTSIHSFLYHLKLNNPSSAADIETLANAENIYNSDEFHNAGSGGGGYLYYTSVPDNGTPVTIDMDGDALQTWTFTGTYNKFYNRMFFVVGPTTTGNSTLTINYSDVDDLYVSYPNTPSSQWSLADVSIPVNLSNGEKFVFAVGSIDASDNLNDADIPFTIGMAAPALMAPVGNN